VQKALGAAGDNADRFRQMMELSSKSMTDATSIQDEFNKKNNNAAAIWEKISRGLREFVTDGVVPDFFNWVTEIVGKITGVYNEAGNGMKVFRERLLFLVKTLAVVTTAVLSYRVAVWLVTITTKQAWKQTILYNTVLKVQAALKRAGAAASYLFAAAKLALTGNIQRATVAMRAFNMATRANPIGLFLTAVTTAITAVALFSKKQKELTAEQSEAIKELHKETAQLNTLRKMIADNNIPLEKRKDLIEKLRAKYPEYLKNIKNEGTLTQELADKLNLVNRHLILKARLKANENLIEEQAKRAGEADAERDAAKKEVQKEIDKFIDSNAYVRERLAGKDYSQQIKTILNDDNFNRKQFATLQNALRNLSDKTKLYKEEERKLTELLSLNGDLESKLDKINEKPQEIQVETENDSKKPNKYTGDLYGQAQKELLKAQRDFIKKQQELEDEETAILEDSLDKQLSAVETKYERKKLALRHENEDYANEIRDLNKKIREASEKIADPETSAEEKSDNSRAIGVYKKIIAEKRNLIEQNNKMEVTLESTKNHELNTTREKYFTKLIQTQNKEFEKCLNLKKAQSDLEIAEIKTLKQAKQKLQEQGYEGQLHKIRTLEDAKNPV
ncbi:hypothetical protein, partial [Capnocytophaga canis]|uniref:hypothetical protein n=1 Tax=Capnocytophaga canis TaxID=1848903 RepID=UPI001BB3798A